MKGSLVERGVEKKEIDSFCIFVQDMYKVLVKTEVLDKRKLRKLFSFIKQSVCSNVCSLTTFLCGLVYLERYLLLQTEVTDSDFKLYYTMSVAIAAKMYEDTLGRVKLITFYDEFVLVGQYITIREYLGVEKVMLEVLDYKMVIHDKDVKELLKKYESSENIDE